MKKYSTTERNLMLQSHLYTLDKQHATYPGILSQVGDLLPGVVLINDLRSMQNVYMNKFGCGFLQKSQEELSMLGPEYFISDVFCREEMNWISMHFGKLIARNDVAEVTGFYQKVRPKRTAAWHHFYLSGKLIGENSSHCIYMGMDMSEPNYELQKISLALEAESLSPAMFQLFASLTKREKQILGLIARGYTTAQIADNLFIAINTVETHRKNINRKLNTNKLSDLIRLADRFRL